MDHLPIESPKSLKHGLFFHTREIRPAGREKYLVLLFDMLRVKVGKESALGFDNS